MVGSDGYDKNRGDDIKLSKVYLDGSDPKRNDPFVRLHVEVYPFPVILYHGQRIDARQNTGLMNGSYRLVRPSDAEKLPKVLPKAPKRPKQNSSEPKPSTNGPVEFDENLVRSRQLGRY